MKPNLTLWDNSNSNSNSNDYYDTSDNSSLMNSVSQSVAKNNAQTTLIHQMTGWLKLQKSIFLNAR